MKVLVVTNLYPTSSSPALGTFVRAQVDALRRGGLDVHLLHVDRARRGRQAYAGLPRDVSRRVIELDPDVVHVMYGGVTADLVTRTVRDRPVIVTFYGTDVYGLPRGASLPRRLSAWYGVRGSRRAARRAERVIVQSAALGEALPKDVPASHILVVPDGVDFDVFRPLDREECRRRLGWADGRRHVLFPADPRRPEKRYELADASVRLLASRGVHVELHALVGVEPDRVVTWLNAADAVLLTSRHEGSPNVVKEALACNVAVVSVDVGDVRERLAGIQGCHIAAATAHDLAAKVELALAHPGRVDARERSRNVSLASSSRALRDLYDEVCRPSNGRIPDV